MLCRPGPGDATLRQRELLITRRLACNRHLADAVHKWAFASLRRSTWAKDYYDSQRARGKDHHAALRTLGNRWLEDPLALPPAPGSLRRSRPRRQPHPGPATSRLISSRTPMRSSGRSLARDGAAGQGALWKAEAGGGGNGAQALVEDRGRPQRL